MDQIDCELRDPLMELYTMHGCYALPQWPQTHIFL